MDWLKKVNCGVSGKDSFVQSIVFHRGVNFICGKGVKCLDNLQTIHVVSVKMVKYHQER